MSTKKISAVCFSDGVSLPTHPPGSFDGMGSFSTGEMRSCEAKSCLGDLERCTYVCWQMRGVMTIQERIESKKTIAAADLSEALRAEHHVEALVIYTLDRRLDLQGAVEAPVVASLPSLARPHRSATVVAWAGTPLLAKARNLGERRFVQATFPQSKPRCALDPKGVRVLKS